MEGACVCIVELVPGLGNEIRKSSEWIDINPFPSKGFPIDE